MHHLPLWDGTQDCQCENLHEPNLLLLQKNLRKGCDFVANQSTQTFSDCLQVYPHWLRIRIAYPISQSKTSKLSISISIFKKQNP